MSKGIDTAARLTAAQAAGSTDGAEGDAAKTDAITALIAAAKASIRARWPDE